MCWCFLLGELTSCFPLCQHRVLRSFPCIAALVYRVCLSHPLLPLVIPPASLAAPYARKPHSGCIPGGGVGSPALLPMSASLLLVLLFTRYQQFHQLSMSFRVTRLTDMTEWSMLGHHPLPPEGLHMSLPSVRLSDEPAGGSLASHPPPAHYSSFPILLPLDGPSTPAWHVAESRGFLTPEPTLPQKNGINKIKQIKIINETMIINEVAFWGVFGFSPHSVG